VVKQLFIQPDPPLYCSAVVECVDDGLEDPNSDLLYIKTDQSWTDLRGFLSIGDKCLWQDCIWRIQNKEPRHVKYAHGTTSYSYKFSLRYLYDADEDKLLEQLDFKDA